jgi:methyl-accepting chemotaxis protein
MESDRLLEKVADLRRLEQVKRTEQISSDEFHQLAKDITRKSHEIMYAAKEEEEVGDRTSSSDDSIDDVAEEQRARP